MDCEASTSSGAPSPLPPASPAPEPPAWASCSPGHSAASKQEVHISINLNHREARQMVVRQMSSLLTRSFLPRLLSAKAWTVAKGRAENTNTPHTLKPPARTSTLLGLPLHLHLAGCTCRHVPICACQTCPNMCMAFQRLESSSVFPAITRCSRHLQTCPMLCSTCQRERRKRTGVMVCKTGGTVQTLMLVKLWLLNGVGHLSEQLASSCVICRALGVSMIMQEEGLHCY